MNGPWFIILFIIWPGTGMETREINFVSETTCVIGYSAFKNVLMFQGLRITMTKCIKR